MSGFFALSAFCQTQCLGSLSEFWKSEAPWGVSECAFHREMGLQDLRLAKENTELATPRSSLSIYGLFIAHTDPEKMGVTDIFFRCWLYQSIPNLPAEAAGLYEGL